jgi:hypothetical protein
MVPRNIAFSIDVFYGTKQIHQFVITHLLFFCCSATRNID